VTDRFFGRALRLHFRVVAALVLRETRTRFGRSQMGYLWALIEPTLFIVTFVAIYRVAGRHSVSGLPAEAFFMCGIVGWFLFYNMQAKMMVAFSANRNLLAYPQVTTFDILIARMLLESATSAVVFVILTFVLLLLNTQIEIGNFILIVYAFAMATLLGAGVGMILCAIKYYSDIVEKLATPLLRLMYFASGPFYSVVVLPKPLRELLLLNPMVHILEIARLGYFREYRDPFVSMIYPLGFALGAFLLGLMADRLTQSKIAA